MYIETIFCYGVSISITKLEATHLSHHFFLNVTRYVTRYSGTA